MRSIVSIAALVALFLMGFSKPQDDHLLPWSAKLKLNWQHFKGKAPGLDISPYHAYTHFNIPYEFSLSGNELVITVSCHFDKSRSWVRDAEEASDALLAHEQTHLDIAELYARKMRKRFSKSDWIPSNLDELQHAFVREFDRLFSELNAIQEQYDEETDHSRTVAAQSIWEKKIAVQLRQLEQYAPSDIALQLAH